MIRGPLKRYLTALRRTMADKSARRDYEWAGLRCVDSRAIHLAVWEDKPAREDVDREVIPLLQKVYVALLATKKTVTPAKRARRVGEYAKNVLARIVNIERYIEGKGSAFDPAEIEPARLAAAHKAALEQAA